MRILLIAIDTRGGVVPYGALADALASAGHEPVVAAPEDLVRVVPDSVPTIALPGRMQDTIEALGATEGVLRAPRGLRSALRDRTAAAVRAILEADPRPEIVVAGVGGASVAEAVAVALGARLVDAHLQPIGPPTNRFPGVLAPSALRAPGPLRLLGHVVTAGLVGLPSAGTRSAALGAAGVGGRARAHRVPGTIYGYSEAVLPRPSTWGPDRIVTGYWRGPEQSGGLGDALEAFLAIHPAPIVAGFGSMRARDPDRLAHVLLESAARVGAPMVVLTGWNGPFPVAALTEDVFVATEAPHDVLYRRASAVVHHGGAGTTAASLTAGVPTVVVPFAADQRFWGDRVHAIGAGPRPVPIGALSVDGLAGALEAARRPRVTDTVAALARRLDAERGALAATEALERLVGAG